MKTLHLRLWSLVVLFVVLSAGSIRAQTDPLGTRTDYRNEIYSPGYANTNVSLTQTLSVAFYSGNIGDAPNSANPTNSAKTNTPTDGTYYLLQSIIGQPVGIVTVPFNLITNGSGTITPAPDAYSNSNWFQLGQTVTLTAQPGRYYTFSNWQDGVIAPQRTVTIASATNLMATFIPTLTLETTNLLGVTRTAPRGTPLILLRNAVYTTNVDVLFRDNIVPTTTGTTYTVTLLSSYPTNQMTYSTDGGDPHGATLYSGPFQVTVPFTIRAAASQAQTTNSASADAVKSLATNSPGGGAVTYATATDVYTGTNFATLSAQPAANWSFMNWTNDVGSSQSPLTVQMTGARFAQAIFGTVVSPLPPSIGQGSTQVDPMEAWYDSGRGLFAFGSAVRLSAIPSNTFWFSQWHGDAQLDTSKPNPFDFTVTNGTPVIQPEFPSLGVNSNALTVLIKGSGTVSSHAPFYANTVTTNLTATTNAGQTFTGWYDLLNSSNRLDNPATNVLSVTMTNSQVIQATFKVTQPTFTLSSAAYSTNESSGAVRVTVQNVGLLDGQVDLLTSDGDAIAGRDYTAVQTTLFFTNGVRSIPVSIPIKDQYLVLSNRSFQVRLANELSLTNGFTAVRADPSTGAVTIVFNDDLPLSGSLLTQAYPDPAPNASGSLQNFLMSSGTNLNDGQWRFPWQIGWRTNGEIVSGLVPGNDYIHDAKTRASLVSLPEQANVAPTNLQPITIAQNVYYPGLPTTNLVSLKVNISSPPQAAWRFMGESEWRGPNTNVTGLLPDVYSVEFKPLSGWQVPTNILQLDLTLQSFETLDMPYRNPPLPLPPALPTPTNFAAFSSGLTNPARLPFAFCGQLWSRSNGWASGCAVRSNVVLTAQHVMFNDYTLSSTPDVRWLFQQQEGESKPRPVPVRGYYGVSGYSYVSNRTADLPPNGSYHPGESSPASREHDVAAVYFSSQEAPSRGGFSGYLCSDVNTDWLATTNSKMLLGYPLDTGYPIGAGDYGYTNIVRGKLHSTPVTNLHFSLQGADGHVYGSSEFLGLPGNSGGPLCVLNPSNNVFYPAGVFLGSASNQWVVRSIDSEVVVAISNAAAATFREDSANSTGGGTIVFRVVTNASSGTPAYIKINLSPSAAISAGAAWRLFTDPTNSFSGDPDYTRNITTTNAVVFKAIPGWDLPPDLVISTNLSTAGYNIFPGHYTASATQTVSPTSIFHVTGYSTGPLDPPVTTNYTISNLGEGALIWAITNNANWLTITNASGLLAGGASTNVFVTVNQNVYTNLPGTYNATIGFVNQTNAYGTTTRTVSVALTPSPATLVLIPASSFDITGYAGGPLDLPTNKTYTISNIGQEILRWAVSNTVNWLSVSNANGVLAGATSTNILVFVNQNAFTNAVGSYTGTIMFVNQTNGNGTTSRSASLVLSNHPAVRLDTVGFDGNGIITLTVSGIAGHGYSILSSSNLLAPIGNWGLVTNVLSPNNFAITNSTGVLQRYFQAKELP